MKNDLVASVQHFFMTGGMPDSFNLIHLILIPKGNYANRVELFRPIALANFQLKLITKILVDRLAPIASSIISP